MVRHVVQQRADVASPTASERGEESQVHRRSAAAAAAAVAVHSNEARQGYDFPSAEEWSTMSRSERKRHREKLRRSDFKVCANVVII